MIFFDRGSEGLTDRARPILAELAQHWLKNGGRALTVAGHTDTSETERTHQGLGARRAQTVAAYLAELGIPADRISVGDVGASRPLVRTPIGAPEPQNRFVDFGMSLNGNPVAVADAMYQRALCIEWLQKTYCDKSATKAEEGACSNAIRF